MQYQLLPAEPRVGGWVLLQVTPGGAEINSYRMYQAPPPSCPPSTVPALVPLSYCLCKSGVSSPTLEPSNNLMVRSGFNEEVLALSSALSLE